MESDAHPEVVSETEVDTIVAETNGFPYGYHVHHFTTETQNTQRFDNLITTIACADIDTFNKVQGAGVLPPSLIQSLKESDVDMWRERGFDTRLVCLDFRSTDTRGDTMLFFYVDTQKYSHTKRVPYRVTLCYAATRDVQGLRKTKAHFFQKLAKELASDPDVVLSPPVFVNKYIQRHEQLCVILQHNGRVHQDYCNRLVQLQEAVTHCISNQYAGDKELARLSFRMHEGLVRTTAQQCQLSQETDNRLTSIEDRLTADAVVSEQHQQHLETVDTEVAYVRSLVSTIKAHPKKWQDTFEAVWAARGTRRSERHDQEMSILRQDIARIREDSKQAHDQEMSILRQDFARIREDSKQAHAVTLWRCVYMCTVCVGVCHVLCGGAY